MYIISQLCCSSRLACCHLWHILLLLYLSRHRAAHHFCVSRLKFIRSIGSYMEDRQLSITFVKLLPLALQSRLCCRWSQSCSQTNAPGVPIVVFRASEKLHYSSHNSASLVSQAQALCWTWPGCIRPFIAARMFAQSMQMQEMRLMSRYGRQSIESYGFRCPSTSTRTL